MSPTLRSLAVLLGLAISAILPACGTTPRRGAPPILQPGPPGTPPRAITASDSVDLARTRHTAADVRFMQAMIAHHAQALAMTALVPSRSSRGDVQLLAERIRLSQADEIATMERWLEARGESAAAPHAHHGGGAMPGMLTEDEMASLERAAGSAFDRLFLELMIKHHHGAVDMVRELLSTPGAAQDPEIFAFASEVEADQQMEIARMQGMRRSGDQGS